MDTGANVSCYRKYTLNTLGYEYHSIDSNYLQEALKTLGRVKYNRGTGGYIVSNVHRFRQDILWAQIKPITGLRRLD